jgi:hypothetical protein
MQSRYFERRPDEEGRRPAEHTLPTSPAERERPRQEDTSTFSRQAPKTGRKEVDCGEVFWTWALRRS